VAQLFVKHNSAARHARCKLCILKEVELGKGRGGRQWWFSTSTVIFLVVEVLRSDFDPL
jgi:hypothetical protein